MSFENVLADKIFLTGIGGDGVWHKNLPPNLGMKKSHPYCHSLNEFRLRVGFAHVPLPLSGSVFTKSILEISNSEEMLDFSVGGDYDRPIARRFAEEAGVPRSFFGLKKRAQNPHFTNTSQFWCYAVSTIMERYSGIDW